MKTVISDTKNHLKIYAKCGSEPVDYSQVSGQVKAITSGLNNFIQPECKDFVLNVWDYSTTSGIDSYAKFVNDLLVNKKENNYTFTIEGDKIIIRDNSFTKQNQTPIILIVGGILVCIIVSIIIYFLFIRK